MSVDWRERLALQHLKSFFSKEDIGVIVANMKNLRALSLDSFKRNNVSASWMVVDVETVDETSLEVKLKGQNFKQDTLKGKKDNHSGIQELPALRFRRATNENLPPNVIKQLAKELKNLDKTPPQRIKVGVNVAKSKLPVRCVSPEYVFMRL